LQQEMWWAEKKMAREVGRGSKREKRKEKRESKRRKENEKRKKEKEKRAQEVGRREAEKLTGRSNQEKEEEKKRTLQGLIHVGEFSLHFGRVVFGHVGRPRLVLTKLVIGRRVVAALAEHD